MADVTIKYNNNQIATMSDSGTKTLLTNGKYCANDFTVQYTKPSVGSGGDTGTTLVQGGTFTPTTTGVMNLTSLFSTPGFLYYFAIARDNLDGVFRENDLNSVCFASVYRSYDGDYPVYYHTRYTAVNSANQFTLQTANGSYLLANAPDLTGATSSRVIRLQNSSTNRIGIYVNSNGNHGFRVGTTYTISAYKVLAYA